MYLIDMKYLKLVIIGILLLNAKQPYGIMVFKHS